MTRKAWWFVIGLFCVGALAAGAGAQSVPLTVTTEPFSSAVAPGFRHGGAYLVVTNNSAVPVTALVFSVDWKFKRLHVGGMRYLDHVVKPHMAPEIMPGETHRFMFGENPEFTFHAAVFADGSSYGDSVWVQRIIELRKHVYESLQAAILQLQLDVNSGMTHSQIAEDLNSRGNSAESSCSDLPPDLRHFCAQGYTLASLEMAGTVTLRPPGSPLPPGWTEDHAKGTVQRLRDRENQLLQSKPSIGEPTPQ